MPEHNGVIQVDKDYLLIPSSHDLLPVFEGFDDVKLDDDVIPENSSATNGFTFGELKGELWEQSHNGQLVVEVYPHDGLEWPIVVEAPIYPENYQGFLVSAVKVALQYRADIAKNH